MCCQVLPPGGSPHPSPSAGLVAHLAAQLPPGADAQRPGHLLPLGQRQQQVRGDQAGTRRSPAGGRHGGTRRSGGAQAIRGSAIGEARALGGRCFFGGAVVERLEPLGRGAAAAGGRQEGRGAAHGGERERARSSEAGGARLAHPFAPSPRAVSTICCRLRAKVVGGF